MIASTPPDDATLTDPLCVDTRTAISDTFRRLPEDAKQRLGRFLRNRATWIASKAADPPIIRPKQPPIAGTDHMPYLRAIWAAPLDPRPLRQYADWLDTVGLAAAASQYRQKADDVVSGLLRPDYTEPIWPDEYWD